VVQRFGRWDDQGPPAVAGKLAPSRSVEIGRPWRVSDGSLRRFADPNITTENVRDLALLSVEFKFMTLSIAAADLPVAHPSPGEGESQNSAFVTMQSGRRPEGCK
jgi:hypothetical protein